MGGDGGQSREFLFPFVFFTKASIEAACKNCYDVNGIKKEKSSFLLKTESFTANLPLHVTSKDFLQFEMNEIQVSEGGSGSGL